MKKAEAMARINSDKGYCLTESLNDKNTSFSNINKAKFVWWLDIAIHKWKKDIYILLCHEKEELLLLEIRAKTFSENNFYRKNQKQSTLEICPDKNSNEYLKEQLFRTYKPDRPPAVNFKLHIKKRMENSNRLKRKAKLKIIIVGANGAVGEAAANALADRHEIIAASRSSGDIKFDIEDIDSIRSMYKKAGKVDAVVSTIGHGHFGKVHEMTIDQFMQGINHKVLPQVNLVLEGFSYMNDNGSFTVTSGVLNRDPIPGGACAAAANGALDGFVLGAAIDMPRGIRINAVSPEVLEVSREKYKGFFPGHVHVTNEAVGLAYCKAVEGCLSGQVFIVD